MCFTIKQQFFSRLEIIHTAQKKSRKVGFFKNFHSPFNPDRSLNGLEGTKEDLFGDLTGWHAHFAPKSQWTHLVVPFKRFCFMVFYFMTWASCLFLLYRCSSTNNPVHLLFLNDFLMRVRMAQSLALPSKSSCIKKQAFTQCLKILIVTNHYQMICLKIPQK